MSPEDIQITKENHQLLSLTEHPTWGVFVRLVEADMKELDQISTLVIEAKREDLTREIEIRYHTILKIRSYINETILRAESAIGEQQESNGIIKHHNISND